MNNKAFKIIAKSKHFIYFVTEENENKNWCLKIAVKKRFKVKFKKAIVDTISGYNFILKIKLAIRHQPNYMKLNSYSDSPYKMKDLESEYRKEIKNTIIKTNTTYCDETIPYYDYALVLWEELNDKEKFYLYETPNQELRWVTIPLNKETTGLSMNVELAMQSMGKIINEPPYIIVQNDYEDGRNLNWVKVRLDGTILDDKKLIFNEEEIYWLKYWIEINKLAILMYWTQEKNSSSDILKLVKPINIIEPKHILKNWNSIQITSAKELQTYFDSIKDKVIGKTIDKIFYTNELYNFNFDDYYNYKNGEWYSGDKKCNEPSYYPWKESGTILWFDSPLILDFKGIRLEIEYWSGSLVKANTNSIDVEKYGANVSRHFSRNIIGHKLADIKIQKTDKVDFMNFSHLGIERNNGDDMFDEIWFIFDNNYKLELTTNHCDFTIFKEVKPWT